MNQKGGSTILILVGMLLVTGVIIGGVYYIGTLKNKPQIQNPVIISQTPPTPTSGNSQNVSKFQDILASNCEKIYLQNSSSYYYVIDIDKLPVNIDQKVLKINFDTPNKISCTFFNPDQPTNYFSIELTDKSEVNVYDKNSQELGHGGLAYLGSYETVIKDDGITKITIALTGSEGPSIIGYVDVVMKGEKQLKSSNGEIIYANYAKTAIDGKDSKLVALLNKYSEPSNFQPGSRELTSSPNDEIKNTFFGDLSNLQPQAKSALEEIEKTLGAISPK